MKYRLTAINASGQTQYEFVLCFLEKAGEKKRYGAHKGYNVKILDIPDWSSLVSKTDTRDCFDFK